MNKQIKTKKTITCSICGVMGHNKSNEKFHPIVVVIKYDDYCECDFPRFTINDDGIQSCRNCGNRDHYKDGVVDEWSDNESECDDEDDENKSFNPDDQDLIIIKGGAPEPIPIVKIQPCVEQTPIEKPILRDSNYDAVIAEINAGVCSLDNAIRINKYILKVRTYNGSTTGIPTYELRMVERFGCCPHDNILDGGKRNTYTVGNIFGETKLEVTPDGQIIYDKTYFKGKDKQKYFATRWFWRPEHSGWTNSYLYAAKRYTSVGVEILGMRGSHLTKDGKYKYEGVSIADLKEACKKNGIKGISGKDKHELVKLLMKV
jgi:hypothetical protein